MKAKVSKKIFVDLTLDSSEAVMFTKGGKHKIEMNFSEINEGDEDCLVEISIQLERNEQGRFDHVTQHARW
jgi:hypothetical protein